MDAPTDSHGPIWQGATTRGQTLDLVVAAQGLPTAKEKDGPCRPILD